MRRFALFTTIFIAASVVGSFGFLRAFTDADHQFSTTWCESPVVVDLTIDGVDGGLSPADGVSLARGAEAFNGTRGPSIRLDEPGSRVQINLGQTLFHTQWLFSNITRGDEIRVDAVAGNARQAISASSVRGALSPAPQQLRFGLLAESIERPAGTGEIDLFVGADEVLFTNEGDTPLELIGAIGCPAFDVQTEQTAGPAWDAESQRFIGEHLVRFQNPLINNRVSALRAVDENVAGQNVEDVSIDLTFDAAGFSSAEVLDVVGTGNLRVQLNDEFDGRFDTSLLSEPLRLADPLVREFSVLVAYEPNFDDRAWEEGVEAPTPQIFVRGQVDSTRARLDGRLGSTLLDATGPGADQLRTPEPQISLELTDVREPLLNSEGRVELFHRLVITNESNTFVENLVIDYPLLEFFGPGTFVESVTAQGGNSCAQPGSDRFDGGVSSTLLFSPSGLGPGEQCRVWVASTLIPGVQAGFDGTRYSAPVTVSAQSGARTATDSAVMRAALTQVASLTAEVTTIEVTNLEDGSHRVEGTVAVENTGDLSLDNIAIALDITRPTNDAESRADVAANPGRDAAPVFFGAPTGGDVCAGTGVPSRAASSAVISGGAALAAAATCEVDFSFVAFPGASVQAWDVSARATAPVTNVQPAVDARSSERIDFDESPAIDSAVEVDSIINNGNGTYSVRTIATITNSGDTPLVSVTVADNAARVFGDQLLSHRRIGDSCSGISGRFPLGTAQVRPDANTCAITTLSLIRPGADLAGSNVEVEVVAVSAAAVEVQTSATSQTVSFSESGLLEPSLVIESVERLDPQTVAFVLDGTVENTGDVEIRNAQVELDLDEAFDLESVSYDVQFLGVRGLNRSDEFDGSTNTGLLDGTQTISPGATVGFRLLVHASPGNQPGPYLFEALPVGVTPAQANASSSVASDSTTVPIVGVVARSLESENNRDGTYSVTYSVTAQNAGLEELPSIQVFTNFERTLGSIIVGDVSVATTCGTAVAAGQECQVTREAIVRPGSDVGPHNVTANLAATSATSVSALVTAEEQDSDDAAALSVPLLFTENPEIETNASVISVENNEDGTYTLVYEASVSNTGDVPLFRVNIENFVDPTFGNNLASDQIESDSCSLVSFGDPLAPGAVCEQSQIVTVRPLTNLGPWRSELVVNALSPALSTVTGNASFDPVTFTEDVALGAEITLSPGTNNGNGTYTPVLETVIENTGDVPLVEVVIGDAGPGYGDALRRPDLRLDSCSELSARSPLLPGEQCRAEQGHRIFPGSNLGPIEVVAGLTARSASGEEIVIEETTNSITLVENPQIELESSIASVESNEDGSFRLINNLNIRNSGDVRLDDLSLTLDLDEVFPDISYQIDGVISDDFAISEAFAAGESLNILAPGQPIFRTREGTITLVVSVEPGADVGPFIGDLRAEATSPADISVSSAIQAQIDLPSIAATVLSQAVDNNRDGSYTVSSTYEITNDGTTDLEFVQLTENLGEIYAGTNARLLSIVSDGLPVVDPEDFQRRNNLIEFAAGLQSGESATLTSTVLVEPGNILGPFQPLVVAEGSSPTGTTVANEVVSQDTIEFVEQPALRVEQHLDGRPIWDGNRFDVTFAIELINDGDVELRGVQVREDLQSALGANSQIIVSDIRSETLVVNRNFNGRTRGDTRLLGGGDTLAAGSSEIIELDLIITPETRGVYSTRVVVSARTPAGADLGGGDQEIEANTLTRLNVQGELGVAKQTIGEPFVQPDGSVAVTYEILVENAGPFPLDNVAVHDQLSQAFGVGSSFETSPVRVQAGSPCDGHASSSFDGGAVDPVLVAGVGLQSGERCRIQFDAVVVPSIDLPGPYRSSAFAIANDPFSGTVIDDSTDGTNTDPDGNQEPGDNDLATPVVLEIPEPQLEIDIEPLASGPLDAAGRFELRYQVTVDNVGGIDVRSPRLIADLEQAWDGDFEVLSIESEGLVVNEDFNGSSDTNLIERSSRFFAGEQSEVVVAVRVEQADSDDLPLDVSLQGISVVGTPVSAQLDQPVAGNGPDGLVEESLFDTFTTQEKRLIGLGAGAILLFGLLFIWSAVQRVRAYRHQEGGVPALDQQRRGQLSPGRLSDPDVEPGLYLDLRTRKTRVRSDVDEPLDLRGQDGQDLELDEHHRARRRRGRPPQVKIDSNEPNTPKGQS